MRIISPWRGDNANNLEQGTSNKLFIDLRKYVVG